LRAEAIKSSSVAAQRYRFQMQFLLDKNQPPSLFVQAREQLLTALHLGTVRAGQRLPSIRQLAQRSGINLKTAFAIYQRLQEEGYIELRTGSGAYVTDMDRSDFDQAYCRSILQLIKSNLAAASHLKLDAHRYQACVERFINRSPFAAAQVAVIECNDEQIHLFAHEISSRLNVRVLPVLLSQLENPDRRTARALAHSDYFVTTDYHFKQAQEIALRYQKKLLQVRLNAAFLSSLIEAARRGRVLMIVSNDDFFPAFRQNLRNLGISQATLDHITPVNGDQVMQIRSALSRVRYVYLSPICDPSLRQMVPPRVTELRIESMLAAESIEAIEALLLFHAEQSALR
jgi:GntR family transcriptional regulator